MQPSVTIDARYLRPPLSGIGRYTQHLLTGLARVGSRRLITVFVSPGADLPPCVRQTEHLHLMEVGGSPYAIGDQWRLPAVLRRNHVGLLHTMDAFAPMLPGKARKIITLYDLIPLVCRREMWRARKAQFSFFWRKWLQCQCGAAAAIVTISQASAADISRELGVSERSITVIPSGIESAAANSEAVAIDLASQFGIMGRYVLYVGRRDPYKNVARLIEAFAQCAGALREPLQLVIAGAADPRYLEPEATAARLGVSDRVRFVGHVSDGQLAALYASAALFVFPSLYEGQGLPPLEAMRAGVPVIASNRAAIPEAVGDAAILVDPTNVPEMAGTMARVLTDPELATDLIRRGYARSAEFTVERQAEATLELYDRLLHR